MENKVINIISSISKISPEELNAKKMLKNFGNQLHMLKLL